jgi:hypothetical protein
LDADEAGDELIRRALVESTGGSPADQSSLKTAMLIVSASSWSWVT